MSDDPESEEAEVAEEPDETPEDAGAEVERDEAEATEETEPEGLQHGDFIRLDYTARTVEDGRLVDTTDGEVAEEEDVEADQEFGPRTIVLGEGHIFGSVEADIVGTEVGETGDVVVPAAEAFGEYDDEEVRTVSKDKIPEDDRYPGAQVQVDGQQGFVETIIGGRARVDFNHPLAGEDIEYEYEVVEEERIVEPDEEEADAEDEEDEGGDGDEDGPEYETVEVEKETLYIEATPQLTMNQQWMMGKQQIAQQLTQLLEVDRIIVQEELGGGMGMPGMMGGMGGMGGGGGDLEDALEEADIDADELADEL